MVVPEYVQTTWQHSEMQCYSFFSVRIYLRKHNECVTVSTGQRTQKKKKGKFLSKRHEACSCVNTMSARYITTFSIRKEIFTDDLCTEKLKMKQLFVFIYSEFENVMFT